MAATYQPPQWLVPNMGPGNINKVGNYSFQFDSAGSQVIQATKDLSGLTECSISCWVKFDFTETSYQYACLLGNTAVAGNMLDIAKQATTGGDANKFYVWDGATAHTTSKVAADKTWYHAVVTQTGTTIKVYIDTVEVSGGGFTGSALNLDNGATKPTITLGAYFVTGFSHELEGELSEVSIYDYALSPGDITTLYGSAGAGVGNPFTLASPPIAYYKGDKAGFGDQWAVPNQVNYDKAFDFDSGSSQYIDVGTVESINNATKYTIAFWGKKDGATDRLDVASKITTTNRLLLNWNTSGNVNFAPNNGATGFATSALAHDTEWHHFAGVFDGTVATINRCILYIDGVLADQTLSGIPTALSATAGNAFEIGAQGGTNFANGEISNVVLFDTNLPATGTESIEALYSNGTPNQNIGSWSNLQGWWKLNQSDSWNSVSSEWNVFNNALSIPTPTYTTALANDNDSTAITPAGGTLTLPVSSDLSFSVWYKSTDTTATYEEIFRTTTGTSQYGLQVGGTNLIVYGNTMGVYRTWSVDINDGNWHHIAYYVPNTDPVVMNNIRLWVDGSERSIAGGTWGNSGNITTLVGLMRASTTKHPLSLSNFAIFTTAITSDADIATLYNGGTPGDISSLSPYLWWKLNNTASASSTDGLYDNGSGGNNGSLVGSWTQSTTDIIAREYGVSDSMTQANLVSTTLARSSSDSNYSFSFDGVGDYATTAYSTSAGNKSLSLWFKSSASGYTVLLGDSTSALSLGDTSATWGDESMVFYSSTAGSGSTYIMFAINNGHTAYLDGNWHHAAIVYNGTTKLVYIDGVSQTVSYRADATYTGVASTDINLTNLLIGDSALANTMEGNLSNISFWNSALSQANIITLYNNGRPGDLSSFSPTPTAWWKLGDDAFATAASPTAWTIPDQIGSNDGTSAGNPNISGEAPGSTANALSENMTIEDRIGESGQSSNNAQSYNMATTARIAYT